MAELLPGPVETTPMPYVGPVGVAAPGPQGPQGVPGDVGPQGPAGTGAYPVQQVALTGNLAYTLPVGAPTDQVISVVFMQTTGGHTVTYGGQPVTVDTAPGGVTTVELHPTGAGYVVRYPASGDPWLLPAPTGSDDTSALQAALSAHAGRRIVGRPGASYRISAPLIIGSNTTLDLTGCTVTLIEGSHCNMLQNAAFLGSGARDSNIHVVGGHWDRGANVGVAPQLFGICFHRADDVSVTGATFHGTSGKYALYLVDVNRASATRLDFVTESDGVHVTGPSSSITIRDVAGATHDDLVSFTGRDYVNYELTPGGGSISDIVVERVTHRGGDGNTVKLLAGAGMTVENATVRDVGGTPDLQAVTLYSDTNQAATTGGTLKSITLENIGGQPLSGIWVYVNALDVQGLRINGLHLDKPAGIRGVHFSGSGTTTDVSITGVTSAANYTGNVVHLGTPHRINYLSFSDVALRQATTGGTRYLVYVQSTIDALHINRVTQWGGESVVHIVAGGSAPKVTISGLHSTIAGYAIMHQGSSALDVSFSGVTAVPLYGLVRLHAAGSSLVIRGHGITARSNGNAHVSRSATQTVRAIGADLCLDKSILTPVAGDVVTDTSGTAPNGVVVYTGSAWKNLWATA